MKITRKLKQIVLSQLQTGNKGVIIYGARQVGKTTLVTEIIDEMQVKTLVLNGDQRGDWWEALTSRELPKMNLLLSGYQAIFVDEAQRIPEIGLSLKIILDNFPQLKVVVTGSSSLDLASKVSEPLTGRAYVYRLFPISQSEMANILTPYELKSSLEERLVFGSYPEIFSLDGVEAKSKYLNNLTNMYLYKDLLEFGDLRNSNKIRDLLKLLAFQIGSQVSLTELSQSLEISRSTVDRYIDLLEKSYVIFRLNGFSRNLRKEVTKMDKIFFYDTGVRNAVIGNFNFIKDRNDVGKLWENFLIVERMKRQAYRGSLNSLYFWRLTSGAELDLIEEEGGKLTGFEFKFSHKTIQVPKSWSTAYPKSGYVSVNVDNYQETVI